MKSRLLIIAFVLCLLFGMAAPLINTGTASADPQSDIDGATFTFQDRANIIGNLGSMGQIDFVDNNINDGNHNYVPSSGNFCDSHGIDLHSGTLNWSASSIYADNIELGVKVGDNCPKIIIPSSGIAMKSISNPIDPDTGQPAAAARFQWDGNNITSLSGQSSVAIFYTLDNAPGYYQETTTHNHDCDAYAGIFLIPGSTNQGTLYVFRPSQESGGDDYTSIPGLGDVPPDGTTKPASQYSTIAPYMPDACQVISGSYHPYTVTIMGKEGVAATDPAGGGGGGGGTATPTLDCNVSLFNPLTWLICPMEKGMTAIIDGLDTEINSMLALGVTSTSTDQPTNIFCAGAQTGTCGDYFGAWEEFRNIALGLMAVAGLIMLISQALGMELLDAYTIRKVLPRLLIASIGITLSWQLMQFAVTLSNDLGYGMRALIYAPFSGIQGHVDLGGVSGLGVSIVGLGAITALGIFGLLSFAATAAISLFVAFLTLVIRQVVVTLMVIIAPVAMVAYILPNTQRAYKLWWESFSKALLMFPLIVAFLAVGRVFAVVTLQPDPSKGTFATGVQDFIGFFAYYAPYFMIPMTFRFAGGIMGGVGNAINSRAEGARNAVSKFRANQRQKNMADLKAGKRFEGKRWIPGSIKASQAFGEASKGIGTGWNGRFGLGQRGQDARRGVDQLAGEEAGKTPGMQAVKGWNDVNRILAESNGNEIQGRQALYDHLMSGGDDGDWGDGMDDDEKEAAAKAQVNRAAKAAKVAGGFSKANGIAAYNNMVRDGTAIRDTNDLARLASVVGNGDKNNTFKYAAEGASISRQVGRSDLAAASEPIGALAFAYSDLKHGNGLYKPPDGKRKSLDQLEFGAWKSGAGGEVAYTKFGTAKGRTIRFDTERAAGVVSTHMKQLNDVKEGRMAAEDMTYQPEEVQSAAAMLVESQNAINNQYGKQNNREEALKVLSKPENSAALDSYLSQATQQVKQVQKKNEDGSLAYNDEGKPQFETVTETVVNKDAVNKIVGDRYAGMSEEQKKAALQRQQEEQENP